MLRRPDDRHGPAARRAWGRRAGGGDGFNTFMEVSGEQRVSGGCAGSHRQRWRPGRCCCCWCVVLAGEELWCSGRHHAGGRLSCGAEGWRGWAGGAGLEDRQLGACSGPAEGVAAAAEVVW